MRLLQEKLEMADLIGFPLLDSIQLNYMSPDPVVRASDRVQKKIKNYAEIFGNIMQKNVLIMRKKCWILQKFEQL